MAGFSSDDLAVMARTFGCGGDLLAVISGSARHSFAPRGRCLHPTGDDDATILLLAGRAHELAYGPDGSVMVVHTIGKGELFGDLLSSASQGEVRTVVYSRCGHFTQAALLRLMENYSAVAVAIARQISGKLDAMRARMVETAMLSATGRICAELSRMADAGDDGVISPAPVVSELAVIARVTRETASRTISQLLRRGILDRGEDQLRIVAPHRLRELIV